MPPWIRRLISTPRLMSFSGLIASAPSAVIDSKPTSNRIAIVDWYSRLMKLCGISTCTALAISYTPCGCPIR